MRKCPKPLINTFAWAIWLKHLALRHIWLLYYKGSVLSIGFVSFFQLFRYSPFFVFHQKLLISYPTGNYRNGWFSPPDYQSKIQSPSVSVPAPVQSDLPFHGCRLPELSLLSQADTVRFLLRSEFRRWFVPCCRGILFLLHVWLRYLRHAIHQFLSLYG